MPKNIKTEEKWNKQYNIQHLKNIKSVWRSTKGGLRKSGKKKNPKLF